MNKQKGYTLSELCKIILLVAVLGLIITGLNSCVDYQDQDLYHIGEDGQRGNMKGEDEND
jgi:hypothetical protein